MVDQATMQPAVAILKRMNIDEAECSRSGLEDWIDFILLHPVVCFEHCRHQISEILRAGADEFRQRISLIVAFAEKNSVGTKSSANKTPVLNEHTMEMEDFIEAQWSFTSLKHRTRPSLQPSAGRPLSFDRKTRSAVSQEQEAGGARRDIRTRPTDNLVCLSPELSRNNLC
jgi:hypothetical protein